MPNRDSCYNWYMNRKQFNGILISTWLLLVAAVSLFVMSAVLWSSYTKNNHDRIFWSAIDDALQTRGVTRTISYESDSSYQQLRTQLSFVPQLAGYVMQEFKSDNGDNSIREAVAFRSADYSVLTKVESSEGNKYKNIEGVWAQTSDPEETESLVMADALSNGPLLLAANLSSSSREKLLDLMRTRKMYELVGLVRSEIRDGKPVNIYKVKLGAAGYGEVMAEYLGMLGMSKAAAAFGNDGSVQTLFVEYAINTRSGMVVEAGYPEVGKSNSEFYSAWGVAKNVERPTQFLSRMEYEAEIQKLSE